MKILMAATPAVGHLDPLLAIGRTIRERGDDVVLTTASWLEPKVARAGFRFQPLRRGADLDLRRITEFAPEMATLPAGPERAIYSFCKFFLDPIPEQFETLRALIEDERPDAVIVDQTFFGSTPLYKSGEGRPPLVTVGVSFLPLERPDGAPPFSGKPPAADEHTCQQYAELWNAHQEGFNRPIRAYANRVLATIGCPRFQASLMHERVMQCDAYLLPTVPAFEYDFFAIPDHVHFIGALPPPPSAAPLPRWWADLDGQRRVVLVTQGTVANDDLGRLVAPALSALGGDAGILALATTGGRPTDQMAPPPNARVESFLPFAELMPLIDLLVTNGGYGSVSMALAAGVPVVVAGTSEDKAEVAARVAWSGTGVNLATDTPTPDALRQAVSTVLGDDGYRDRARMLAEGFAKYDSSARVHGILNALLAAQRR